MAQLSLKEGGTDTAPAVADVVYDADADAPPTTTAPAAESRAAKKANGRASQHPLVVIALSARTKRKYTTTLTGLGQFGVNVKSAAKAFATHFACGASLTAPDEITIQGDVRGDLADYVTATWPSIGRQSVQLADH